LSVERACFRLRSRWSRFGPAVAAIVLVSVTSLLAACGGDDSRASRAIRNQSSPISFRIVNDRIVVDAVVAGRKVPMILGTGSPTVISERLLRLVKARVVGTVPSERAGKGVVRKVVELSSVRLGGLQRSAVRADVVPLGEHSALACASPNGLLGATFLKSGVMQIDFGTSQIRFANVVDDLGVSGATRIRFRPASSASPTPQVAGTVGSLKRWLDFDTGNQRYLVLDPGVARRAGARVGRRALAFSGQPAETLSGPIAGTLSFAGLPTLRLRGVARRDVVAATGSATKGSDGLGIPFMRDFVVTIDWTTNTIYLEPTRRPGDGSIRTYGYLPRRVGGAVVAGAVMRDGPAEAAGVAVGDVILEAGGRRLERPSRAGFCTAYSEAFAPIHERQRLEFEHAGAKRSTELLAVDVGPGVLEGASPAGRLTGSPPSIGEDRSVLVDGDSLAVGMRPYLADDLPGWTVTYSASTGRHAREGVKLLRRFREPLPGVIVMSLGTNDDPRDPAAFRDAIRLTISSAGPRRCVVWPNIVRPPYAGTSYAAYNRVLEQEAGLRGNLILVDWAGAVRGHPEWLAPDRVHLSAAGYRARADAVARAVRLCE
jgi:lysophospholipase L1-like esterase